MYPCLEIAVGYNRTATGNNMGHRQNSAIDIFRIFQVSFVLMVF